MKITIIDIENCKIALRTCILKKFIYEGIVSSAYDIFMSDGD